MKKIINIVTYFKNFLIEEISGLKGLSLYYIQLRSPLVTVSRRMFELGRSLIILSISSLCCHDVSSLTSFAFGIFGKFNGIPPPSPLLSLDILLRSSSSDPSSKFSFCDSHCKSFSYVLMQLNKERADQYLCFC